MPEVFVSIGSNIERNKHIAAGIAVLAEAFGELQLSPIYETPAEGFEGDAFYNMVAGFDSEQSPRELNRLFKDIEDGYGRDRNTKKFSSRTLDIDLLLYGDAVIDKAGIQLPRDEILKYSFVLQPLADLQPDLVYPGREETLATLWKLALKAGEMKPAKVVTLSS